MRFLIQFANFLVNSFALAFGWNNFIAPTFDLPLVSFGVAIAFNCMVALLVEDSLRSKMRSITDVWLQDNTNIYETYEPPIINAVSDLFNSGFILLILWIVSLFI